MKDKQFVINVIATMLSFVISLGINFFLTPYITETVGTEAYGFVSLANNFVNYATILTIALNSMAGRFITIKIHQNKMEEANKYFTSILVANILFVLILILPSVFIVTFLDNLLNISVAILLDVKILFLLIFINFWLSIIDATFSTSTFAKNRLDLRAKINIQSYIIKAIVLLVLFRLFNPHVAYIGIAACIVTTWVLISNIHYTKKLLPEIEIHKKYFDFNKIVEVVKAGIWNTITKLSQVFTDGLDLLICNLWINPLAMGQLSIVKTISGIVATLLSTISSIFQPELTIIYAKGKIDELVVEIKKSMKFSGFFANIPLCFLIGFGEIFYSLWVPNEDAVLLVQLTILTLQGVLISGAINPLYSIYTITNKIKADSILRICMGVACIVIVFLLLQFTNLGIYAVAGVSTLLGLIVNFIFVPSYTAHCLNKKWTTFYPTVIRYMITTIFMSFIFILIRQLIGNIDTWIMLIVLGIISSILGLIINYLILLNSQEKKYFVILIKNKLLKNKI